MIFLFILAGLTLLFGFVVFFGSPYVPTLRKDMKQAFDQLYQLSEVDTVVDLGSGDGIVLREAARRGAKAIGVELNPALVIISKLLSLGQPNVKSVVGNLRTYNLPSDVTLVYIFANSRDAAVLSKRMVHQTKQLKKTFHVLSYGCDLPHLIHLKSEGAYHLYKTALQPHKPQV